ncbi:MAG: hypothetical protein QW356_06310 [Candidatus Hadarchaeales archaeon]
MDEHNEHNKNNLKDRTITIRCSRETAEKWSKALLVAKLHWKFDAEKLLLHLLDRHYEPRPRVL